VFLPGYQHYLRTAAALQWDQASVDLRADAVGWSRQSTELQERLLILLCGFSVGEEGVASTLEPFALATERPEAAACFRAQALDEARQEGRLVASAWGDVIDPGIIAHTLALHRRRLLAAQASSNQVAA
jgi:hypothetical protein